MNRTFAIGGALLIDGTGADPIENATVIVEEGRLTYAGASAQASLPKGIDLIEAEGATVMPGLMDVHVHISLSAPASLLAEVTARSFGEAAFEVSNNLGATVAGGVTTIRTVSDLGHLDIAARDAITKGKLNGPRVHPCGHGLTSTGGHGDIMPCWLNQSHGDIAEVVDGPDEIRKGIRRQAKAGATWIKLFQTGGVVDPHGRLDAEEFLPAEFEAALEAANLLGIPVCVHAHNKPAILRSIHAGCRSIEHGMHFDEDCAALALEHGTWLVPTLTVMDRIIEHGAEAGVPDYIVKNVIERTDQHRQYVKYAYDLGVNIASGTDAGSLLTPHGTAGMEVVQLVKCGLTPVQAIEVATRNTARLLRLDTIGTLEPGVEADLLIVDGDVGTDPGLLTQPANMRQVMIAGRPVAAAGRQLSL